MKSSPAITGVIVADDDPMICSVIRAKLEALDQTVLVAGDGLEAVRFASRIKASVIILDLNLPRLNGLLACQQIREMPHNAMTPIVILTSMHGKEVETAAARVGATMFLTKPFRSAQLLQELSRFLSIDDVTRHMITRSAERAALIAQIAPAPTNDRTGAKVGPNNPIDRGKNILAVLRG